jgi:hypothetical protein
MSTLTRADLWSLEQYAEERAAFRSRVMEHKKHRQLALGEHLRLYFEDSLTIKYQVQEMLRIERIFELAGIIEELDTYNPLIPDGCNWKATLMIEYADPALRAQRLAKMIGIEDKVWLRVGDGEHIYPIADEDLERATADKTSSVHFLRFELGIDMVNAAHAGASISAGVEHPAYPVEAFEIPANIRDSLVGDLDANALH